MDPAGRLSGQAREWIMIDPRAVWAPTGDADPMTDSAVIAMIATASKRENPNARMAELLFDR
jgi:hypothetical protein